MSVVHTQAIVIHVLKYSDTSLIVKLYTASDGLKSYMLRGVLNAKRRGIKAAYFQPLSLLSVVAQHKNNQNLHTLKEVHIATPCTQLYTHMVKQTIVMFLSEVLSSCIQEEEANEGMFQFIEQGILWLENNDSVANFHLVFLMNLTSFLGFYPDTSDNNASYFDLLEGTFSDSPIGAEQISGNALQQFSKLLHQTFELSSELSFSKKERQFVLDILMRYYQLHLEGFRKPRSIAVLETLFG